MRRVDLLRSDTLPSFAGQPRHLFRPLSKQPGFDRVYSSRIGTRLSPENRYKLFAVLAAIIAIGAYLFGTAPPTLGRDVQTLAFVLFLVATIPSWIYLYQASRHKENPIPLIPLIGFLYGVYFGLAIFSEHIRWMVPFAERNLALHKAIGGVIAGLCMLLFGFYASSRTIRSVVKPLKYGIRYDRAANFGFSLVLIGGMSLVIEETSVIPTVIRSAVAFGSSLLVVGITLLFIMQCQGKLTRPQIIALDLFVVPAYLLTLLGTGLTTGFGLTIILLGIIYWTQKKSIPVLAVVVGVSFTLMIRGGGTGQFREEVWYGETELGVVRRGVFHIELAYRNWITAPGETLHNSLVELANRMAYTNTLAYVISVTPHHIPFWKGGSYGNLPLSFVPRIVWPTKPNKDLGQQFGHRYGVLDQWDRSTSYNLPYLVEFFINFGWIGVFTGMFLVGVAYRVLETFLNPPNAPNGTVLLGATMLLPLSSIESDLSLLFGNVVTRLVLYLLILSPVLYRARRSSKLRNHP